MYREVEPYNIENTAKTGKYLNVHGGRRHTGANVQAYNNPRSRNSQWKINGPDADGLYTIQNVAGGAYLSVAATSGSDRANVQVSSSSSGDGSKWSIQPTGEDGVFELVNQGNGGYLHLPCGWWCRNVETIFGNAESQKNHWRIVGAWQHAPFQAGGGNGAALLDKALTKKGQPQGALPATCTGDLEKLGSWCYKGCASGYEAAGARCKVECGSTHPVAGDRMCGKAGGDITNAINRMVVETVVQALTVTSLVSDMRENGLESAGALTGTIDAFVDMGKPFAHPSCNDTSA